MGHRAVLKTHLGWLAVTADPPSDSAPPLVLDWDSCFSEFLAVWTLSVYGWRVTGPWVDGDNGRSATVEAVA